MRIQVYPKEVEAQMLNFYDSLSEKDRRRYAAIEATKLGYGGDPYICRVLHCDDRTITRGQKELQADLSGEGSRLRAIGGGRKPVLGNTEGLDDAFLEALKNNTAGSPMDDTIKWTHLSRVKIAGKLKEQGFVVSVTVVDQLLKKHGFHPRRRLKQKQEKATSLNGMSNFLLRRKEKSFRTGCMM